MKKKLIEWYKNFDLTDTLMNVFIICLIITVIFFFGAVCTIIFFELKKAYG